MSDHQHCWHEIPLSIVIKEGIVNQYYQCCHCGQRKKEVIPLAKRKSVAEIMAIIEEEEAKHGSMLTRGKK